jgi:hypothetical protein
MAHTEINIQFAINSEAAVIISMPGRTNLPSDCSALMEWVTHAPISGSRPSLGSAES